MGDASVPSPFRTSPAFTGRFVETHRSPEAVILSAAKDLRCVRREILRCAQDDTPHLVGSFPKKPTCVSATPTGTKWLPRQHDKIPTLESTAPAPTNGTSCPPITYT